MINLRYHIVSLVAVFLALALGVLIGSTVLDQGVVRVLQAERNSLASHRDRLADENMSLNRELALWDRFGRSIVPELTRGRLRGRDVTVLVTHDADPAMVDEVISALEHAQASIAGMITFTNKWALRDQPSREQLALVLGRSLDDADELLSNAAAQFASRLAAGGDPESQTDLLRSMERNGFLQLSSIAASDFPPQDTLAVLVTTADDRPQPPIAEFQVPFLQAVQDQIRIAVAQPLDGQDTLVEVVRGDDLLAGTVATIDHADTLLGELALVYALRDAAMGLPARHYGIGEGASGIVPDVAR